MGLPGTQLVHRALNEGIRMPPRTEADIRASLDEVIGDVERNQRIYGWFAGNVGQIARDVRDLSGRMEYRFEQVDQQFKQVDVRFDQVDQRFAQVDRRFDQVDQRFAQVDQRFDQVDERFAQVDRRFDQVDQRFAQVDERFAQVDRRFDQVDERLDGLDQRVDGLETNMNLQFGLVHDSLRKLDARMERLVGYIVRDERKEGELVEEGLTKEKVTVSTKD